MYELIMKMSDHLQIIIRAALLHTWCKCDDSQFSILEGADEDVVLLHRHVFMAVRGDDLVAQKQETVKSSEDEEISVCVCE